MIRFDTLRENIMGDVKSTLELVMEKTRGMNLSPQEKFEIQKQMIEREARSLVMPYLRGEDSLEHLQKSLPGKMMIAAMAVLAESLEIEADNDRALEGLAGLCSNEPELTSLLDRIQSVLEEHEARIARERARMEDDLLQELAQMGISGPAVKPAINADPTWQSLHKELTETYSLRLKEAIKRLLTLSERKLK
jgi:cyanate lyase